MSGKARNGDVSSQGYDRVIDARGLKCPLPVLHTRRALKQVAAGKLIEVFCTDPVSVIDIPNLVREEGAQLVASESCDGQYRFVIAVGENK